MGNCFPPISMFEIRCLWFLKVNNSLTFRNDLEIFFVHFYSTTIFNFINGMRMRWDAWRHCCTLFFCPLCGLFTPEIWQSPRPGSQSFPLFLIYLFHSGHGFIEALRWYEIKICLRKWFATIFFKETSRTLFNCGKPWDT